MHEQKHITTQLEKPGTMPQKKNEYYQGLKWPAFSDHTIKEYFKIPVNIQTLKLIVSPTDKSDNQHLPFCMHYIHTSAGNL